jgi:hypothetical protein
MREKKSSRIRKGLPALVQMPGREDHQEDGIDPAYKEAKKLIRGNFPIFEIHERITEEKSLQKALTFREALEFVKTKFGVELEDLCSRSLTLLDARDFKYRIYRKGGGNAHAWLRFHNGPFIKARDGWKVDFPFPSFYTESEYPAERLGIKTGKTNWHYNLLIVNFDDVNLSDCHFHIYAGRIRHVSDS